jgi:hypothetical protein
LSEHGCRSNSKEISKNNLVLIISTALIITSGANMALFQISIAQPLSPNETFTGNNTTSGFLNITGNELGNDTAGVKSTGKSTVSQLPPPPQAPTAPGEEREQRVPLIPPAAKDSLEKAREVSESLSPSLTARSTLEKGVITLGLPNLTAANTSSLPQPMNKTAPMANIAAGVGFDGLNQAQSGGWTPPDPTIAVGPRHIIEMTNLAGQIFKKDGTVVAGPFSLDPFFNVAGHRLSDPFLVYDTSTDRFFASILDITSDSVRVAVSQTNDPTASWNTYNFVFSNCPDQPFIAVSADKFAAGANTFSSSCSGDFAGAQDIVVGKADLIGGSGNTVFQITQPDVNSFSEHPVRTFGTDQKMLLVSVKWGDNQGTIKTITYTGQVPNAQRTTGSVGQIINTVLPPRAIQPSTSQRVQTNDGRLQSAVMSPDNRMVWLTFNDACFPSGDAQIRSCVHLVQFDSTANTKQQDVKLGVSNTYLYYPSLAVVRSGSLIVAFAASSSVIHPSVYTTGQVNGSGSTNTFDPVTLLKQGSAPNTSGRYGDYQGAALEPDPTAPNTAWIAGEYNPVSAWSTFITELREEAPGLVSSPHS